MRIRPKLKLPRNRKEQGGKDKYISAKFFPKNDPPGRMDRMKFRSVIVMVWQFIQSYATFAEGYSFLSRKGC